LPLLKAPSKQPAITTLQVRLEEEVRHNLDRYAEFIGANASYVVSEALKVLFKRDADAMAQCFLAAKHDSTEWVLEGDIKSCFDKISHAWLLAHVPMDRVILRKRLELGYVEQHVFHETTDGTPQGGIISPALANFALDGLERLLRKHYPTGHRSKSLGGQYPCVNFIRYADDFVITGRTRELLEGEVKPLVERFLRERGLELSPEKTVITPVKSGFDFLGQNVRKYPNGKLLIMPSRENIKTFLEDIRGTIKAGLHLSAAALIEKLNPKIRGWANYHRHVVSKRIFNHVDHDIFGTLWRWARRRHPNKNRYWLKTKYFGRYRGRDWNFFGIDQGTDGQPRTLWLNLAFPTPIRRHIKVKGETNPYDPAWENYFAQREAAHMLDTLRGYGSLRHLWYEQRGLCPVCQEKITRTTGWRLHHCVPRVFGGPASAENRVLLHPECRDTVQHQRLFVSKPRLLGGARRA